MTDTFECSAVAQAFEAGTVDAATFHHVEHVRVAFDLLHKYDFIDGAAIYARGLRTIASKAGVPQKFNLTITYAFMSLIAERLAQAPGGTFAQFVDANSDLMSKDVLARWYKTDRLLTETARSVFLLPDLAQNAEGFRPS